MSIDQTWWEPLSYVQHRILENGLLCPEYTVPIYDPFSRNWVLVILMQSLGIRERLYMNFPGLPGLSQTLSITAWDTYSHLHFSVSNSPILHALLGKGKRSTRWKPTQTEGEELRKDSSWLWIGGILAVRRQCYPLRHCAGPCIVYMLDTIVKLV